MTKIAVIRLDINVNKNNFIWLTEPATKQHNSLLYNKIIIKADSFKFNITNHLEIFCNILHYLFTYFILNKNEPGR